ncbi:REST corepressor isoform X1 [Glossina fuscipes]|uniref:REST corepressor isoform X1 n=1 Tax=Glossina fuscipes TaxID=7396 RepID=A0A8U0WGZ2_9MUSC|nr:REST corepressor isoform X1 [Glossina fuscipes]XP_037884757.1 REST corepressor isoform X1 [Glossina fuscipes]XP_037884764.1 REST corepressor isoform X1 [Glossina fuscipes]XP_037884770.1 REST corepressor isoform X1 [Glossina fuscipes]KAI9590366.1 hypothetical protein GQX74_008534 [Glossina fuscipes]
MVLAERNAELVRNGRRSRGPSPNGHGASSGSASGTAGGPGGAGTPETSSDDDNSIKRNGKSKTKQSEYEEKIRVGRDYQAVCPPLIPEHERKPECLNDRALLVWSPTKDIPDTKLEEYISVAKEKYGYNGEQALGMLFWHKHDLERAVMDLANFTPFPDEWTVEDKVLFEQAFQFHGKSFHRIRQMLPDKSIASLVKYYYSWKKTRHRQSVMDRQEKTKAGKEGSSDNGSDNGSNEDSDNDDKDQTLLAPCLMAALQDQTNSTSTTSKLTGISVFPPELNVPLSEGPDIDSANSNTANNNNRQQQQQQPQYTPSLSNADAVINCNGTGGSNLTITANSTVKASSVGASGGAGGCCSNCGVVCNVLNSSPHGKLCSSCHHHWRRTGNKRPTSGPYFGKRSRDRNAERHKRKPPRGMYINHDDIVALASANDNQDELLANVDREIVSLLSQVQLNKQQISALKRKNSDNLEDIRPSENTNRINGRWTNDELLLAVQGVRKYGKDFQTIAETIGTKTEANVRTFFMNNRRRYNLDQILKKYEAEKEASTATVPSSSSSNSGASGASTSTNLSNDAANAIKKDEQQQSQTQSTKKKDVPNILADDSDNTTSSETANCSKSTTTTTSIEERKSEIANVNIVKDDDEIMEVNLNTELLDGGGVGGVGAVGGGSGGGGSGSGAPSAKKIALSVSNQDFPKASAV